MITPQYIRDYITQKFTTIGKLSASNDEFIMESLFIDNDWKRHMSVNLNTGLWQCFKSGKKGNFVKLYAEAEGISYLKAQQKLIIKSFDFDAPEQEKEEYTPKVFSLDNLTPLNLHSGPNEEISKAWLFCYQRGLFDTKNDSKTYYVSNDPKFSNRIIIPFEEDGTLFYFQARSLSVADRPKYLNPDHSFAKSSHVLYPYNYDADHLVICEGPLDAISLQNQGVNATCTLGCSVSDIQMDILSDFKGRIIVGYDNDEAGKRGLEKFDRLRKEKRMNSIFVCCPPSKYKDWNDAHIDNIDLNSWVLNRYTEYSFEYQLSAELSLW